MNSNFIRENLEDLCASIQSRINTILINKLIKAVNQTGITEVGLAGGVSANSGLRALLEETGMGKGWKTYIPKFAYCTDNAAMIAMAGHFKASMEDYSEQNVLPMARFPWD